MDINGAQQAKESDIDRLIKELKLIEDSLGIISSDAKDKKGKKSGSIPKNPKDTDLQKMVGNLGLAVPTGFLLLHNDLEKLINGKGKGGGKAAAAIGGGLVGAGLTALATGGAQLGQGLGAAAGGMVKGLFSGLKPDSPGQKHIDDLIDQMNLSLTLEDVQNMPGVKEEQQKGISTYIKTYFISQAAAMVGEDVTRGIVSGAIEGVTDALLNLLGLKQDTPLEKIVNDLMATIKSEDYIYTPEVQEAAKNGIVEYIKTYFVSQSTAMALDTVVSGIGTAAGGLVNGVFKGLFGADSSKSYNKINTIVESIIEAQSSDKYIGDTDVSAATKEGIIGYLKTYFKSQAISMSVDTVVSNTGEAVGGFVTSAFKGLFGKDTTKTYDKIQVIIEDLIDSIDSSIYVNDTDVKDAEKSGIIEYLKTYFKAQTTSMSVDTVVSGAGDALGGFIKGAFNGLFGKDTTKTYDKVNTIVENLIENISVEELQTDEDAIAEAKNGILKYMSVYFKSQTDNMSSDSIATGEGSKFSSFVSGVFSGLFGNDNSKTYDKLTDITNQIIDSLSVDSFTNDAEIAELAKEGIYGYVRVYFNEQANAMAVETKGAATGTAVIEGVKEGAKSVWNWITGSDKKGNNEESVSEKYARVANEVISYFVNGMSASMFTSNSEVIKARNEGMGEVVKKAMLSMSSGLVSSLTNDTTIFTSEQKKTLGAKFIAAVGNSITDLTQNDSKIEIENSSKVIASSFDDNLIRQGIQGLDSRLANISDKMNSIIENAGIVLAPAVGDNTPKASDVGYSSIEG